MATQNYNVAAYTLNATTNLPPQPVIAKRAPVASDLNFALGTLWIYKTTNQTYVLTSVVNNASTWSLLEAGGSGGAFSTLSSTGNSTIATAASTVNSFGTGSGAVNTIGSAAGASGTTISVGTGNFSLDGVAGSIYTIGASTTTGTVAVGGSAQTGTITLGSSSGTNIVAIGAGTGATTVNIAGGATNAKAVNIANGAVANVVVIGSTTGAASTTINAGSGNINLAGVLALSSAGPQILFGAGVPSASVPKGSLYINTSAVTAITRLYVATDAVGTWAAFTAAA